MEGGYHCAKYYFTDDSNVYCSNRTTLSGSRLIRRSFSLPKWIDQLVHPKMTSTQLSNMVNKPLRRSSLALHRMNSRIKSGHSSGVSSSSSSSSSSSGHNSTEAGFEELRTFIKAGSEFAKELVHILNERSDAELTYAKSLSKLSSKLLKSSRDLSGSTVNNAWHFIAEDMESAAEIHRSVASVIIEECVKPLKTFADIQHKSRKSLESLIDKRAKAFAETRTFEGKTKSKSYGACRDNERVQDQVLDCKLGRGRVLSDKELGKLQVKRQKSEETSRKCDSEYYSSCLKAERSRLDWESGIERGCSIFRQMEEKRLIQLQSLAEVYHTVLSESRPKLVTSSKRLEEPVRSCDVERDMDSLKRKFEFDGDIHCGESILPDFYSEDVTNAMNQERRRQSMSGALRFIESDIEKERKGRSGVENLAKALAETPKFGGEDSLQDVQEKIQHMTSMITYLEACRFKVSNSLNYVDGKTMVAHPYIDSNGRDKAGMAKSILKLPPQVKNFSSSEAIPDSFLTSVQFCEREGSSSGVSEVGSSSSPTAPHKNDEDMGVHKSAHHHLRHHHFHHHHHHHHRRDETDDYGDDEDDMEDDFDSDEEETVGHHHHVSEGGEDEGEEETEETRENEISEFYYSEKQVPSIGRCTALYDYKANLHDELTIFCGDVINIHDKQNDDWWLGELRGTVGVFPATYVEEIK